MRPIWVALKPTVFISCIYYLLTFAWVVGINTTLAIFLTPLYNFGPKQIGFFYFTPIVGALLGEIVGHWLHDFIATRYIKATAGISSPRFACGPCGSRPRLCWRDWSGWASLSKKATTTW